MADRAKDGWHLDAHNLISFAQHEAERLRGRDSHRGNQLRRMAGPHRPQRRDHRRTGGNPVVEHDNDATGGIDRRSGGLVLLPPPSQAGQLDRPLSLEIPAIPQVPELGIEIDRPCLIDGSDGELRVVRRPELVDEHHVKVSAQGVRNDLSHEHCAARDRQHQRMLASIWLQLARQELSSFRSIFEWHGADPFSGDPQ